jgi:hypothetical protein
LWFCSFMTYLFFGKCTIEATCHSFSCYLGLVHHYKFRRDEARHQPNNICIYLTNGHGHIFLAESSCKSDFIIQRANVNALSCGPILLGPFRISRSKSNFSNPARKLAMSVRACLGPWLMMRYYLPTNPCALVSPIPPHMYV